MCIITAQIDTTDKLSMRITTKITYDKIWPDFLHPQWSRQAVITVFRSTWKATKIKWSRHRSFLYECDRSPKVHVLKLGIEILNLKQYDWSTKLI